MLLQGELCRLRALEPEDLELMYTWENNPEVWHISGTTTPFSRFSLEAFIESQRLDIFQSRQQRLIIEEQSTRQAVGAIDLFEVDPLNRRAGVGILIHEPTDRTKGYGGEALRLLMEYARKSLNLHQLWCNIEAENQASKHLFTSLGFRLIGTKANWNWSPEGWRDEALYQCIL